MFFDGQNLHKFFKWLFYIFIAIFPFVLYEGYLFNGTSTRAINTVLFVQILSICIGAFILHKKSKLSFVVSPITISLLLLLVSLCISSFLGVDLVDSFWSKATRTTGLFYFLHMASLYFLFWISFEKEVDMRNFLKIFVFSAGLFSIISVFGQEGLGWFFKSKPWEGLTIGNSTFAGMYLYAGFMISIYLLNTQETYKKEWWKNLLPIIFILNPYLLNFDIFRGSFNIYENPVGIIGSAQASAITLFVSTVILFVFWAINKIKQVRIRQGLLFAGIFISVIFFSLGVKSLLTPGGVIQKIYLTQSSSVRPLTWQLSKEAIAEKPLFGWGIDNFDMAFQEHYDSSILDEENGGEAWMDRAHNILIDQTVESGYFGIIIYLLVYLVIIGSLCYVILISKNKKNVILATVLLVYFFGHLLEIQTAFDTTITYILLVIFSAISAILFNKTREEIHGEKKSIVVNSVIYYTIGLLFLIFGFTLFFIGSIPILRAQNANGDIRRVGSSQKRLEIYPKLFSSNMDRGSFLWRTSNDIQRGVSLDPKIIEDPNQMEGLKNEIEIIISEYEKYLVQNPGDYRSMLNLSDMYIYQRLMDVDNLDKAHLLLDRAILLVPQSPQAYWMKSVAYLYQAKFNEAKEWSEKAYNINPGIEESQRVKDYVDRSVKEFPVIDLYSFKQI